MPTSASPGRIDPGNGNRVGILGVWEAQSKAQLSKGVEHGRGLVLAQPHEG